MQRQNLISIVTTTALCIVLGGAAVFAIKSNRFPEPSKQTQIISINPKSQVLSLVALPVRERALQLSAIAQLPQSLERDRARYLLASDLIAQSQGVKALPLLENLEQYYPVLAALLPSNALKLTIPSLSGKNYLKATPMTQ